MKIIYQYSGITNTPPQTESHRATSNQARAKKRADNPPATRYLSVKTRFIAIDGEGMTFPDGTHRYVLLGIGNKQISDINGLSWEQCFEFLWDNFQTGSVAYVGFFLGYDFVQMLKGLPEERARMLLTREGKAKRKPKNDDRRQPFPVHYKDWQFDILGSKRLKLRKWSEQDEAYQQSLRAENPAHKIKRPRWMYICDTGPFFQKSFLDVIDPRQWSEPIVSQKKYDKIVEGKNRRSDAVLDEDMKYYNRLENETQSIVMEKLNEGFQSLGINLKPSQWYGPGQPAQAWLNGRAITRERLQEVTPAAVIEAARMSYFGGWFEIMAHGHITGTTWEYDINSAYPWIISQLPCLEHGEWERNGELTLECLSGKHPTLVYARVSGDNPWIGAMLHRDAKGNIYRPTETEGWYWLHELQAADKASLIRNRHIYHSWTYHPCACLPPFKSVRDIYALRRKVGKKTPLGIACKLVPNSLYGKFAQSIGDPKYGNPIYASLITAGCRTAILNAIATHPNGAEDVLMVATDGIFFRNRHPNLPITAELGDYEETQRHNMLLFKPGVYWDDKTREQVKAGDKPVFKARGVSARDFGKQLLTVDGLFEHMTLVMGWPRITFPVSFSMISAVQALERGKWDLAGTIMTDPTNTQSADPASKRTQPYFDMQNRIWRSIPRENKPYEASHPYKKRFGMQDPYSQESEENNGITPDGLPAMLIREIFYSQKENYSE